MSDPRCTQYPAKRVYLRPDQIERLADCGMMLKLLPGHGRTFGLKLDRQFGDLKSSIMRHALDEWLARWEVTIMAAKMIREARE